MFGFVMVLALVLVTVVSPLLSWPGRRRSRGASNFCVSAFCFRHCMLDGTAGSVTYFPISADEYSKREPGL